MRFNSAEFENRSANGVFDGIEGTSSKTHDCVAREILPVGQVTVAGRTEYSGVFEKVSVSA